METEVISHFVRVVQHSANKAPDTVNNKQREVLFIHGRARASTIPTLSHLTKPSLLTKRPDLQFKTHFHQHEGPEGDWFCKMENNFRLAQMPGFRGYSGLTQPSQQA